MSARFTLFYLIFFALCIGRGEAFAQTAQFEGFNLHTGLGAMSQNIFKANMVYLANPAVPINSPSDSMSSSLFNVGAGYTKVLSEQFTLGLEFNMSARDSKPTHSMTYIGPNTVGLTMWNTNQYTLSFAPGYLLTPDTLVYSKIGVLRITTMCANDSGAPCASNHLSGRNFGLGVKQALKDSSNYFYIESNKNQLFSSPLVTRSNPVAYTLNASSINFVFGFGHDFH